jgi:hypothetical protein
MSSSQREGFEGTTAPATTGGAAMPNERDGAKKYVDTITGTNTNLKNGLNIPQYRVDYENVLIQLDDYIGYCMLKQALDVNINLSDTTSAIAAFDNMNKLQTCKTSLDNLMKWMDKQK